MSKSSKMMCLDYFINKLKILLVLLIIFSLLIMIYSFGFNRNSSIWLYTKIKRSKSGSHNGSRKFWNSKN